METKALIFVLTALSFTVLGQNDFRNVKWGMTIDEVKKAETSPLTKEGKNLVGVADGKEQYDGMELVYDEVTVAGEKATLYYEFQNGRLIKCRVVYKYGFYLKVDDPIAKKILEFNELYTALKDKGFSYIKPFQCGDYLGVPDYSNPDNNKLLKMSDVTQETVDLIEKMVMEKQYKSVFFHVKNERSICSLEFPTRHADGVKFFAAIMTLHPNGDVKKKIDGSDF